MANYTSGGYFEVSVVKFSARSNQIKGGSYLAQFNTVNEKRKTNLSSVSSDREMLNVRFLTNQ
jgi:hypothetical protein